MFGRPGAAAAVCLRLRGPAGRCRAAAVSLGVADAAALRRTLPSLSAAGWSPPRSVAAGGGRRPSGRHLSAICGHGAICWGNWDADADTRVGPGFYFVLFCFCWVLVSFRFHLFSYFDDAT